MIKGYRVWRVDPKMLTLWSVTTDSDRKYRKRVGPLWLRLPWPGKRDPWLSGVNTDRSCAACATRETSMEACKECSHGFYAMKRVEDVVMVDSGSYIIGAVGLSGRVVEAEDGYRAEKAIPLEILFASSLPFSAVRVIAERYKMATGRMVRVSPNWFFHGLFFWLLAGAGALVLLPILVTLVSLTFFRPNIAVPMYYSLFAWWPLVGTLSLVIILACLAITGTWRWYALRRDWKSYTKEVDRAYQEASRCYR